MDQSAHNAGGWLNSPRRTGKSLLGLAQIRFELFALELQEESVARVGRSRRRSAGHVARTRAFEFCV